MDYESLNLEAQWVQLHTGRLPIRNRACASPEDPHIDFQTVRDHVLQARQGEIIYLEDVDSFLQHHGSKYELDSTALKMNFHTTVSPTKITHSFDFRKNQAQVLKQRAFFAVCPGCGEIISSGRSIILNRQCTFYLFFHDVTFYIIVSHIVQGFPVTAIYFPTFDLLVLQDHASPGCRYQDIRQLKITVLNKLNAFHQYFRKNRSPAEIAVPVGHPNFAHHLWNELSGVQRLVENNLWRLVDRFLIINEPLGPVDKLFPEIEERRFIRLRSRYALSSCHHSPPELIHRILDHSSMIVNVTDDFIKRALTERIISCAQQQASADTVKDTTSFRSRCRPLIWIAIRTRTRSWLNQEEGILRILQELYRSYPHLGVVFDGFSLPWDFHHNPSAYPLSETWLQLIEEENHIVEQITQRLKNLPLPIKNLVGAGLPDAVLWAQQCDLYLAPYGSIQHKVAWLAEIPGIVHTNRTVLRQPINHTHRVHECALPPRYIDPGWIKDQPLNENDAEDPRENLANYTIPWKPVYRTVHDLLQHLLPRKDPE